MTEEERKVGFVRHRDKPSDIKRGELLCKLGNGSLAAVAGITGVRPIGKKMNHSLYSLYSIYFLSI